MINKYIILILLLMGIPTAFAAEGYGTTTPWVNWQGCDQNFEVNIGGHNITYPHTFDYILTYSLVYRDANDVEQTVELEDQSFNRVLEVGMESYNTFDHFIPSHTLNQWILEVESGDQSPTNKTRYVKVVLDSTLTDNGGTHEDELTTYIWFTGCYAEGTFEDQYPESTTEHGFDVDGIGGEGGSGALYSELGFGEMDEGSKGTKRSFNILFYAFIPFLFILLWLKMATKINE